jgi:hypothetical protein
MMPVISVVAIALALTILIALSALYLRTSYQNTRISQLKIVAKTYFLGNTAALRPFQNAIMVNPENWDEYDTLIYEPEAVKEHILWPCVLCIVTVFAMSSILFMAFEWGLYHYPSMLLGGALEIGSTAEGCPGESSCTEPIQKQVDAYQLGALEVVMYSFLAAYVWAIAQLFQRMVTRDVTVYAFHSITVRIVTVAILSLVFFQLLSGVEPEAPRTMADTGLMARALAQGVSPPEPQAQAGAAEAAASTTALVEPDFSYFILMAFAIGFFPEAALRWLAAQARQRVFGMGPASSYLDIETIEGIETFTRARLAEVGILEASRLAASNPLGLALRTPYPLQQVIDWIGQAQLLVLLKEDRFNQLREQGIRTSFQFYGQANELADGHGAAPRSPVNLGGTLDVASALASLKADPAFEGAKEVFDKLLQGTTRLPTGPEQAA